MPTQKPKSNFFADKASFFEPKAIGVTALNTVLEGIIKFFPIAGEQMAKHIPPYGRAIMGAGPLILTWAGVAIMQIYKNCKSKKQMYEQIKELEIPEEVQKALAKIVNDNPKIKEALAKAVENNKEKMESYQSLNTEDKEQFIQTLQQSVGTYLAQQKDQQKIAADTQTGITSMIVITGQAVYQILIPLMSYAVSVTGKEVANDMMPGWGASALNYCISSFIGWVAYKAYSYAQSNDNTAENAVTPTPGD